ncbi:MAG TPA: phage tail tape measure protein [Nitratidesulfovibrio sp.]|nr:phage tail tape measure protein [Nitratidesulfovibrio sp.]
MADAQRTVEIIFNGVDNMAKATDSASKRISDFTGSLQGVTTPVADFTKGVLATEAAIATLVAGGFALAINAAGQFGDSFNEITTIISGTDSEIKGFKDNILDYARTSGSGLADINKAIYNAISSGVDYKDALAGLAVAEKLATAGQADLNGSYDLLTSTLNAYGAKIEDASRYSDVFFQTVNLGKTTIPELAASLAQVTGLAATAGMPIETLGASIAALTATGLPTSQAITGIKQALQSIIKPSTEAEKMAQALGIQFNAAALKSKGFDGVLNDVKRSTGGNTAKMAELFGSVDALNSVLILTGKGADRFKGALDAMKNSAGATEAAYAKMADNFSKSNQNLANNLEVTLVQVGEPLLAQYGKTARALGEVFAGVGFGLKEGAFDEIFTAINSFGKDAEALFKAVAKALPAALTQVDFTGAIDAFGDVGAAIEKLFIAMFSDVDITTPDGLASVIQKLVDGVEALTRVTAGVLTSWEPFVKKLAEAIDKFTDLDDATQSSVGEFMGFATALDSILNVVGGLSNVLDLLSGVLGLKLARDTYAAITAITGMTGASSALGTALAAVSGPLGQVVAGIAAFGGGYALGTYMYNNSAAVRTFGDALGEVVYKLLNWNDTSEEDLRLSLERVKASEEMVRKAKEVAAAVTEVPNDVDVEFSTKSVDMFTGAVDDASRQLDALPDAKVVEVKADADTTAIATTNKALDTIPKVKGVDITVGKDGVLAIKGVGQAVEAIPDQKKIDLSVDQVAIAKIKSDADIIQSALEIKGKIEVAGIEAETERIKSAFDSINVSIESTGDVITDLLKGFGSLDTFEKIYVESQVKQENARRDEALRLQKELVESQVAINQARAAAYSSGNMQTIQVSGEGLAPELEAFMWKILERIRLRVASDSREFLLGIGA